MAAFRERALDAIAVTQAKAVGLFNINMHFQHRIRAHPTTTWLRMPPR
jgi:hypothetical protein